MRESIQSFKPSSASPMRAHILQKMPRKQKLLLPLQMPKRLPAAKRANLKPVHKRRSPGTGRSHAHHKPPEASKKPPLLPPQPRAAQIQMQPGQLFPLHALSQFPQLPQISHFNLHRKADSLRHRSPPPENKHTDFKSTILAEFFRPDYSETSFRQQFNFTHTEYCYGFIENSYCECCECCERGKGEGGGWEI